MFENKLTRRQALKVAGAAALGGLAFSTMKGGRLSFAQEEEEKESWERYIDAELEIEMGDMYFQLKGQEKNAPITVEAGKIYLFKFNSVMDEHNAHFGKDPDLDNRFYKTRLFEDFFTIELEADQVGEVVLQIPNKPGDWEIGCFLPGHYEAGMKATLIVK